MPWPRFRNPIQKLIVPTADLGLGETDFSGLQFPADVPLVLALQVVQTPNGPRILQTPPNTSPVNYGSDISVFVPTTTISAAGSSPAYSFLKYRQLTFLIEITAITGAPANVTYRPAISLDGTTWYAGPNAVCTTTGLCEIAFGGGVPTWTAGNNLLQAAAINLTNIPFVRIDWLFTGGTLPTATHKITLLAV